MRRVICVLAALSIVVPGASVPCSSMLVSPVVIDDHLVDEGHEYTITLTNTKPYPLRDNLEFGWFTLDSKGGVDLDWSEKAAAEAETYLALNLGEYALEPFATSDITLRVISSDFTSISPAVCVEIREKNVCTRLAVLFLLSTGWPEKELQVRNISRQWETAVLDLTNPNPSHVSFRGRVQVFQSGALIQNWGLPPMSLLAQSRRQVIIPVVSEADKVIVLSEDFAGGSVVLEK